MLDDIDYSKYFSIFYGKHENFSDAVKAPLCHTFAHTSWVQKCCMRFFLQ